MDNKGKLAKVPGLVPGAASGNTPPRLAGSFAKTAHRAIFKCSALLPGR